MSFGHFLGWFLLNVMVPLLLPIALLPWLGFSKQYRGRGRQLVQASLAEGQLFWSIIAMCAAAIYEALIRVLDLKEAGDSTGESIYGWISIVVHAAIILISAALVFIRTTEVENEKVAREHAAQVQSKQRERQRALATARAQAVEDVGEVEVLEGPATAPVVEPASGIVMVSVRLAFFTAASFSATHLWAS